MDAEQIKRDHPVITGVFAKHGPEVPTYHVAGLLVSALEGGSNYWYYDLDYEFPEGVTIDDFREGGKFTKPDDYWHPAQIVPFVEGCAITLKDAEGDDPNKVYRIDRAALLKGLELFASDSKFIHHWADFIKENDDAITADVFFQFVVFGECIYG